MKCQAYIDPETKIALEGEALATASKNPDAPRCGYELEPGDSFCPFCGASVVQPPKQRAKSRLFWIAYVTLSIVTLILSFVSNSYSRHQRDLVNDTLFRTPLLVDDDFRRRMNRASFVQENQLKNLFANMKPHAVEHQDAKVQFHKGMRFYDGDGVEQDKKEAVKWFR